MDKTQRVNISLFIAATLMLTGQVWIGYFLQRNEVYTLFAIFGGLFTLYFFVCNKKITSRQFGFLIGTAIVLRLSWLLAMPQLSDDYARFVWDGRLSVAGYNPLKYTPAEVMKQGYPAICMDKSLYNALNSQTYYTCYPPLLQLIFTIAASMFPHNVIGNVAVLRTFNMAADTGTIFLLMAMCRKWKLSQKLVLLYALNPLIIAELTGNLHFEGIMIFCLLAAVYLLDNGRYWWSILLFSASVVTKLIPLMLLPLMFFHIKGRKGLVYVTGVCILSAVSFLPFLSGPVIHKFWSSINSYFQESEYNASIYYLVRDTVYHFTNENHIEIIGPLLSVLSGVLIILYAFAKRRNTGVLPLFKFFSWTFLIYYAFTTTVFPWYITPVIAFSVFTGYTFPLVWSVVSVLSYYTLLTASFTESYLLVWIEYLVLGIFAAMDFFHERKKELQVYS